MTKHPHVPAAFINVIREEGSKDDACNFLQQQWNETCALRTERDLALSQHPALLAVNRAQEIQIEQLEAQLAALDQIKAEARAEGFKAGIAQAATLCAAAAVWRTSQLADSDGYGEFQIHRWTGGKIQAELLQKAILAAAETELPK